MKQKHFENIKIIVKENNDMPINCWRSSVGIKYTVNGIIYGLFLVFEKPALTVSEVVEAVNQLLKEMINEQPKKKQLKR
jgi:hypothetical protein